MKRSNGAVPVRVTFSDAKCVQVKSSEAVVRVTLSRAESAQVDVASNAMNTFVIRAAVPKNTVFTVGKNSVQLARTDF